MVEQLFGSKTRVKLLQLFYSNPNRSFYVREITRKIDEQINSVRRELSNLLSIGIISSDTSNNRLYYQVNKKYEYYKPLHDIFSGITTTASKGTNIHAADSRIQLVRQLGNVDLAVLLGHFTRDESAGVDLLVVGDINQTKLGKFIQLLEVEEGRDIRYSVFSPDEFEYRLQIKDRFISTVQTSKKEILVDQRYIFSEPEPNNTEES